MHVVGHVERGDLDVPLLGELAGALDGAVDDVADGDGVADRLLAELDPGQLEQVVDRAGDPVRLVDHPRRPSRWTTPGSVLVDQRLGEHGQRPDGRLQLVADVGDEVGAHGVDAPTLALVLDRRHRATARQRARGDGDAPGRPVELERLRGSLAAERPARQRAHGVVDEQAAVRAGERAAAGLRYRIAPVGVDDDDADRQPIEHSFQRRHGGRRAAPADAVAATGARRRPSRRRPATDDSPARRRDASRRHDGAVIVTPGRSPPGAWRSGRRRRPRAPSR